jgi:hypothetical protein
VGEKGQRGERRRGRNWPGLGWSSVEGGPDETGEGVGDAQGNGEAIGRNWAGVCRPDVVLMIPSLTSPSSQQSL